MKLVCPDPQLNIDLQENRIEVISVEEPSVFTKICGDLWKQCNGRDGDLILSDNESEYDFSKAMECIYNPFSLDCNNHKVIGRINQELAVISKSDFQEKTLNINTQIMSYLDELIQQVPYPVQYDLNTDISGLFKLYGISVNSDADSLAESIIEYMRLMSGICHIENFCFIDLKSYISADMLKELYKSAFDQKLKILIIESYQRPYLSEYEKNWIIDKDKCIIELE